MYVCTHVHTHRNMNVTFMYCVHVPYTIFTSHFFYTPMYYMYYVLHVLPSGIPVPPHPEDFFN